MSGSANGHIVIRRQAKDGKDGQPGANGAKMRWGIYSVGKAYCSGASGEPFYDLVFHVTYQQFFLCIRSYPANETHNPSKSTSNGYWEYQPALDNLFVDILCANNAFLNNLKVRNLDGAKGTFSGSLLIQYQNVQDVITPYSNGYYLLSTDYQNYRASQDLDRSGAYAIGLIMPIMNVVPGMTLNIFFEARMTKSDCTYYVECEQNQENHGIANNDVLNGVSSSMGAEMKGFVTNGGLFQFVAVKRYRYDSYCTWVLVSHNGDVEWIEQ